MIIFLTIVDNDSVIEMLIVDCFLSAKKRMVK